MHSSRRTSRHRKPSESPPMIPVHPSRVDLELTPITPPPSYLKTPFSRGPTLRIVLSSPSSLASPRRPSPHVLPSLMNTDYPPAQSLLCLTPWSA
ncbi:hypothetical protein PYCCODRAFT_1430360 [Trametes coccinea BRFM310]|uniref:Uncharacterized protein n=1 Tax=Trametes coccinea (strain BRFM310) TaxID=1353009 RepID=A0A1Y2J4B6_TRAC3|nr:hypothetical protein PYCCODRAFT_1430360 [Trametes coccinea BRFM310]